MELMLPFPAIPSNVRIKHGDEVILLGSCFADSMAEHFQINGFSTTSNPFGTIFHPLALADVLESSLSDETHIDLHQRDDLYFSWDSSSKIYGMSSEELEHNVLNARKNFRERLVSAKLIVITFGTSWGYVHTLLNNLVANCHKERKELFNKELSSVDAMTTRWKETIGLLKEMNSDVQVVFSVSPVRHSKDGLIDNNRSKARLIEAAHELCDNAKASYFPAYELVIDQLRDYRFFKRDLVHPSGIAVSHVWDFFQDTYFSSETKLLAEKVKKINTSLQHKQHHPESINSEQHLQRSLEAQRRIEEGHPYIYWM
ncbi:MAG: hypothetical protein ACI865_001671 [Flavobacteriaceae bacterium]|jgi:hypothetical protein